MKANYVHKDALTATDYVELNKNNELLISYNQALLKENQELKLELSGYRQAILEDKDMLGLKEENTELKKQLTTYKILHRDCKVDNLKNISKIEEMENQQKEFIEYMNKTIEELECEDVDDEEMKGYLIQRIDTFKEILRKYKSIIGVSDEKEN